MTATQPLNDSDVQQILFEHSLLLEILEIATSNPYSANTRDTLDCGLVEIRQLLSQHLQRRNKLDPVYDLAFFMPRLMHDCDQIRDGYRRLLSEIDAMIDDLHNGDLEPPADFEPRLRQFVTRYLNQEQKEQAVLQKSYLDELDLQD